MKYLVSGFVGIMVSAIILYQVTLPTINSAVYAAGSTANLSSGNVTLSGNIQTLLIVSLILGVIGMAFYAFE